MWKILGRLIGRKGRTFLSDNTFFNSYSITSTSDVYRFNSFKSLPFLHFSRCTHLLTENPKNGLSSSDSSRQLMEIKREKKLATLKKGDTVNLSDLLFTKNRDYLIKCKDDQRVKAEQLEGKMVVLYFDTVLDISMQPLMSLMHIYNGLQPSNNVEVVFVDNNDFDASLSGETSLATHEEPDEQFEDVFPTMPWTAVPLADITSRIHLRQIFGIPEGYVGVTFVIDSTGVILQWMACNIFSEYGVPGYPFSDERIDFLKSEDDAAIRQPSLKALLASPERDYLITNKGDEVPIHTLEDKVVALFFYTECVSEREFAVELKSAYKKLAENDKNFEVVLIYLYDTLYTYDVTNEDFWKTFKTMPWLALPFRDSNYKKLKRIFPLPWEDDKLGHGLGLTIIGPHMEFIEPFGLTTVLVFGTPAYPFSAENIAQFATKETKKLKLEMLWHRKNVFGGKYGSQVRLSQLVGKRVIILFDSNGYMCPEDNIRFLETLKERYMELRGTDDEFEVIHMMVKSYKWNVPRLPWFVLRIRYHRRHGHLFSNPFVFDPPEFPSLVAFDRDGSIVRKTTLDPTFEDRDFPFYAGGMEKEALSELVTSFDWGWLPEEYSGTIYTYKQNNDSST